MTHSTSSQLQSVQATDVHPEPVIQKNNPLHGVSLEKLLTHLVAYYGWHDLSKMVNINCFKSDPSIKSSLKFLRKTDWAREKVEQLYIDLKR